MSSTPPNQTYQPMPGCRPTPGLGLGWFKVFTPLFLSGLILAAGCASGTHTVTGRLRPQVDSDTVVVYQSFPAHARIIGTVSAVSYHGLTLAQADADALNILKQQAAGLGANGIVISNVDDQPLEGARNSAKAIFVYP
jgi:hypothetical protein